MLAKALRFFFVLPFLGFLQPNASAQATGTIMGTVTAAESGGPLAGAQVSVQGTVRRTVTDAQGRYRITIEPGTYMVQVSTLGRQGGRREVAVTAGGTATRNFSLATSAVAIEGASVSKAIAGTITGKVTDAAEHPVAGVVVHVQPANGTASAHTNRDGVYVISGLPAGKYNVTTSKKGYKARNAHATVKAGEKTQTDFTIQTTKPRS